MVYNPVIHTEEIISEFAAKAIVPESLQVTLIVLQSVGSILSLIGSSLIILMILKGGKENKPSKIHNRILMGMSSMDLLNDFALAIATLPAPREYSHLMLGASGNWLSCSIQGFLITLGFSVPNYNSMLSLYYLAVIKYDISDHLLEKYEPFAHGYALLPSIFLAALGVFFDAFGPLPNTTYCSFYDGCDFYEKDCVPSTLANFIFTGLFIFCFLNLLIIVISMIMIYLSVRKQSITQRQNEYQGLKYRTTIHENAITSGTQHQETFIQACLYVSAYTITFVWIFIQNFSPPSLINNMPLIYYIIYSGMIIFYPLQGLWNFITFVRPRYILMKKKHEEYSFWKTMHVVVFGHPEEDASNTINSDPMRSHALSGVLSFSSKMMPNQQSIGNSGVMGSVTSRDNLSGFEGIDDMGASSLYSYGQSTSDDISTGYPNSTGPLLLRNNVTNYDSTMRISADQEGQLSTTRTGDLAFRSNSKKNDASQSIGARSLVYSTNDETSQIDDFLYHHSNLDSDRGLDAINENIVSSIEDLWDSSVFSPSKRNLAMLEQQDRIKVRRNLTTIVAQDIVIEHSLAEMNHSEPEVIEGPPCEIYIESSDTNDARGGSRDDASTASK